MHEPLKQHGYPTKLCDWIFFGGLFDLMFRFSKERDKEKMCSTPKTWVHMENLVDESNENKMKFQFALFENGKKVRNQLFFSSVFRNYSVNVISNVFPFSNM